jgi:hypothetical protein
MHANAGPFHDWTCDSCDAELQTEGDSFREAWDEAKTYGWRSFKDARGEWKHKCVECVGGHDADE